MDKRAVLLEKIKSLGFPDNEVFVSVDEFFDGNDDTGSIGVNIYPDPPSLGDFREKLTEISHLPGTGQLLIRIADIDGCDWFYTDAVYISGNYDIGEIADLFADLKPDEVYEGFMYGPPVNSPPVKLAARQFSIWWD